MTLDQAARLAELGPEPPRWCHFDRMRWRRKVREIEEAPNDADPVAEVEERVARIIDEHEALWGCDDPACAVRSSTYAGKP